MCRHLLLLTPPLPLLFFLTLLLAAVTNNVYSFTKEPPGRDPISVDKVRRAEKAISLTADNFDEMTKGKLVFVKFYSPHCPHCKEISNAWNELTDYYHHQQQQQQQAENNNAHLQEILIGSIDCTNGSPTGGKDLCTRFQIIGLPTILYGDTSFGGVYLEEYRGGKTFDDLKQFASKSLIPLCHPGNLHACSADERRQMESYMAMSYNELNAKIQQVEKKGEETRVFYEAEFDKLQSIYDDRLVEKIRYVAQLKDEVRMIKEVMAEKTKPEKESSFRSI